MNFGKQFLASLLGSTLAMVIAGSLLIFIFVGALVGGLTSALEGVGEGSEMNLGFGGDIEEGSVLHLTFDAPLAERGMELPFTIQFGSMEPETQMGLNHFLADMERAAEDDQIEGILIQADMVSGYPSMMGEVRDALAEFKASGKCPKARGTTSASLRYLYMFFDCLVMLSSLSASSSHPQASASSMNKKRKRLYFTPLFLH